MREGSSSDAFERTTEVGGYSGPVPDAPSRLSTSVGRYVLLDVVGQGAGGVVYRAYDPDLNRQVAVKTVHASVPGEGSTQSQDRLLREAQAIARLSHPNVVSIHDVGALDAELGLGRGVYVVMELVDGQNLSEWIAEAPRSWREVIDTMMDAAKGLAAAHRAGLVHRDFKPGNVLLGKDGRVAVADFGLARSFDHGEGEVEAIPRVSTDSARSSLETDITGHGVVLGTPLYMSPEQHLGKVADTRSDQFSFCVSVYRALYREPPFAGDTVAELFRAKAKGKIEFPSERVPRWLESLLRRGMSAEPDGRFESMDEIIGIIEAQRRRPRRWAAWAGVGGVAVLAAVAVPRQAASGEVDCETAARERAAEFWNDDARDRLVAAFDGAPAEPTARSIDAYVESWVSVSASACETGRSAAGESTAAAQRMCLQGARGEVEEFVGVVSSGHPAAIKRAPTVSAQLPETNLCEAGAVGTLDAQALMERGNDAQSKLRRELGRLHLLESLGQFDEKDRRTDQLSQEAERLDDRWALAEIAHERCIAAGREGVSKGATGLCRASLMAAERSGDDVQWLRAASTLLKRIAVVEPETASLLEDMVLVRFAALPEYRRKPKIESSIHFRLGQAKVDQRDHEGAIVHLQRSIEVLEAAYGKDDIGLYRPLNALGRVHVAESRYSEGTRAYQRGAEIARMYYGNDHLIVGLFVNNIANAAKLSGRFEEARTGFEEALRIKTKALGPSAGRLGTTILNLANVERALGLYQESIARSLRVLPITVAAHGNKSWAYAQLQLGLAKSLRSVGSCEDGEAARDEAQRVLDDGKLKRAGWAVELKIEQARCAFAAGDSKRAVELLESAHSEYLPEGATRIQILLHREYAAAALAMGDEGTSIEHQTAADDRCATLPEKPVVCLPVEPWDSRDPG